MKINKVEVNNFYSIKKVVFNFDKVKGILLVNGKNKDTGGSNGSGKSALVESVVWGVFGKTIRKSTEATLINLYTKKNLSVRITVNDNVVIERGKKPTYLRFFVGGEERTLDNALHTQKLIEEHLNINYKVFLASTVFGQQNNIEFVSASPEDKRTILKNFLNLDSLFDLRDSVKHLKSKYSASVKREAALIEEHKKTVISFDKKLIHLTKLQEEVEGKYGEEVLSLSLSDILQAEKGNMDTSWTIKDLSSKKGANLSSIKTLEKSLKEELVKVKVCRTCGNKTSVAFHPRHVSSQITELTTKNLDLDRALEAEKKTLQVIPISSPEFSQVIEYNQLKKESETFEGLRKETYAKIEKSFSTKLNLNNKYEIMRFWEKAFSEAGLVKYIIRNVLSFFNGKTNFYLSHLSKGKFVIEFDEELRETVKHNGQEISFHSLSGGEKRKISLAVMLGLQQLLTLSKREESNIMFFDEVAENLDQDGLDGLYILLSELKKNKTLFIITHNNYLKSLMDNVKTLTITKHKGISSLTTR